VQVTPEMLEGLRLGGDVVTPSRASGVYNLLEGMRKRARQLTPDGRGCGQLFPSLTITAEAITPQGAFAEAQATYLEPNPKMVQALVKVLQEKKVSRASTPAHLQFTTRQQPASNQPSTWDLNPYRPPSKPDSRQRGVAVAMS
jgi:hypothetical protein